MVVINRTKPVKRPVSRDSDSDHIGDGNQAAIAVILMIAGVGGIGAIVAHDEHVVLGHGYREREGARIHAGANVGGLIDGHAVDGHRLARALAFDHVTGQADQSLDEVPATGSAALLLIQPVVGIFEYHDVAALQIEDLGGELAGHHAIAGHHGVHHRARRNLVKADGENANQQHDKHGNAAPQEKVA